MKRMTVECDCERGGDCTKTTACATDSALQDQAEAFEDRIRFLIQDCRDSHAPDQLAYDLDLFVEILEEELNA
jgi:hypothetical protein